MQLQTKDQLMSTIGIWTKQGLQKLRTTLGEIVGLHNCAAADKGSIDEHYRNLDKAGITKITRLHNCAVADIMPQLWHDVTPQLRSSAKRWMVKLK